MTRIKHFVDEHLDLTGFVGFVVLVLLMRVYIGFVDSHGQFVVRLFIMMGAISIISAGIWIIDAMGTPSKSDS
jgi:hypothetical protein